MKNLADRLRWARAEKSARNQREFTQADLAKKARVSQGAIGHLESGRTSTSRRLTAIADVLGVDPKWLAEGKGEPFATGTPASNNDAHESYPARIDDPEKQGLLVAIRLLALFEGTDADGRAKILRVAERVPQVEKSRVVSNQM